MDLLQDTITDTLRGLPAEFIGVAFQFGYYRAIHKDELSDPGMCDFRDLCFGWNFWYRWMRLNFSVRSTENSSLLHLCHLNVIGIAQFDDYGRPGLDRVAGLIIPVETAMAKLMPGISQLNSIRKCECAFHTLAVEYSTHYDPPKLCVKMGGKWVCEKCQEYIEKKCILPFSVPKNETSDQQKERAKLTATMRFWVLERDEFRCKACGANPRDDKSVKLHVDHIIPIAKGGKTVLENLHCLCSKCNLAKSDHIVEQMTLWDLTNQDTKHERFTA